jgi:ParB/RepB/Spo0J family partition protein
MKETLAMVSPSEIQLTGWNPREEIKGDKLEELKTSISKEGIQVRLVVRKAGKGYELIDGERRLRAAKDLKLKEVPVIIREATDQEVRVIMLISNLQRKDLSPLEEASGLQALIDTGVDSKDLAKSAGKSETWVQGRLALNAAPDELKDMLKDGAITALHVTTLVPFLGYPIYTEKIEPWMKQDVKYAKQRGDTLTFERFDRELGYMVRNDYHAERILCLTDFPYEIKHLKTYFDDSACKKCMHVVVKKKDRICLNRQCYSDKLNQAKQAFEAAQAKKIEKMQTGGGISTKKLEYGTYEDLEYATFDKRPCKKCDKCKVDKSRSSTLDRGKGEQRLICLNPSCFRGKKAQLTRAKNKAASEQKKLIRKCFTVHCVNRKEGLTAEELRFVLKERSYNFRGNPKITAMDQKGLENLLLSETLRREIRDNGYDAAALRNMRRTLPFKVNEGLAKKVADDETDKDEED